MPLCTRLFPPPEPEDGLSAGAERNPRNESTDPGDLLDNSLTTDISLGNESFNEDMLSNHTLTTNKPWISIDELQMVKVVVLVTVVGILLLSTCRIIFRTFSRYTGRKEDAD